MHDLIAINMENEHRNGRSLYHGKSILCRVNIIVPAEGPVLIALYRKV